MFGRLGWLFLLGVLSSGSAAAWAGPPFPATGTVALPPSLVRELAGKGAGQCLWVIPDEGATCSAMVAPLEKDGKNWRLAMPAFPASIGRTGLAAPGAKREGDEHSPFGLYALGFAFGYAPKMALKWPYRPSTEDDIWVDDPAAEDYNRPTTKAKSTAKSFEYLKRKDDLYKLGIVVEYNTDPVVKGMGSAIFVHIWSGPGKSTSGCVAFAEENLRAVLEWLDPVRKPSISFGG